MKGVQIFLCLAVVLAMATASDMCNFQYSVPKFGGSCEPMGGMDPELEDRVIRLRGGVEGIKVIGDANVALTKELHMVIGRTKFDQQEASQQLEVLAVQIRNLEAFLNVMHDEPVDDAVDDAEADNEHSLRVSARDPNRLLRQALQEAEMKVRNMTHFMLENARRHSMLRSSMEARIMQQHNRQQSVMSRVSVLEKQLAGLTSVHPHVIHPSSGATNHAFSDLVTKSVHASAMVSASIQISNARFDDLNLKFNDLAGPLAVEEHDMKQLYTDTLNMYTKLNDYQNDISTMETEILHLNSKWAGNIIQNLGQISTLQQRSATFQQQVQNVTTMLAGMTNTISIDETNIDSIKSTLDDLAHNVTTSLANLTRMNHSILGLENLPVVALAEVEENAKAEIQREMRVLQQLQQAIKGIQNILATFPVPTPAGSHHPRRAAPWYKHIICGD